MAQEKQLPLEVKLETFLNFQQTAASLICCFFKKTQSSAPSIMLVSKDENRLLCWIFIFAFHPSLMLNDHLFS